MSTTDHLFNSGGLEVGYRLFLPKSRMGNLPLILFLHGKKKRGNDLSLLDDYGLIHIAETKKDFKYAVVAPQCPKDVYWTEFRPYILELLDEVIRDQSIDRTRIFLTGFSMGGQGVWDLAANTEGIFTAAAPISGWYDANKASKLTSIPIWAFHDEEDEVIPISETESLIKAIHEVGGNTRFTRYKGMGHEHSVMYKTYSNPDLYTWFDRNVSEVR